MKKMSVAAARTDAEMTQKQAALALGITPKTYCKYEKGHSMPSVEMAFKIAALFGRSIDEIRFTK